MVAGSASTRCTPPSTSASTGPVLDQLGRLPWASLSWRPWGPRSAALDELRVAIDGDGCFQMTAQELATCTTERIPIKVLILNNGHLGMVRQWQELFYDERYPTCTLGFECLDYVKLAEAYGALGLRRDRATDVDATLEKALATDDQSVDFRVDTHEGVFPMVPAGRPNDEIILGLEFFEEQKATPPGGAR